MSDEVVTAGPRGPLEDALSEALPRLRRHLASRGSRVPGVDPEDVLQEVLARALRYRASFDAQRELWPWLRRVAEHVLHDQREASSRRETTAANSDAIETEPTREPDHTRASSARDELRQALTGLSSIERDILLRFHQGGESVRTIARDLSMPTGSVKSHLHRARRRLAQAAPHGDSA